jgi:hypothetical protein
MNEKLGPADRIIQTVLAYADHCVHNRAGIVIPDAGSVVGVKWLPVTHAVEEGEKVVYELRKIGHKSTKHKLGKLGEDGRVKDGNRVIGRYQPAGLYPEVAVWMYRQVAEVWKLDNEFSAKWASYAFTQEHRDLKTILAAFLLVQSRKGDPVLDGGKLAFFDEDYRDVGEAMLLLGRRDGGAQPAQATKAKVRGKKAPKKKEDGNKDFNPKLLLRVHDILCLPGITEINRELGFGKSARHPFLGRWPKAVGKWLLYREENPKMLDGLIKAGFRSTVMDLARRVGYKPATPKFFEVLRWKQTQAEDGRRTLAIGLAVAAAESWEGLSEEQICEVIIKTKPNFKRVVGLLPKGQGLTRAIVAAAIEAGSFSDKDLIIATPTLEDLGLLEVPDIKERWEQACKGAEDSRAANIATRVRSKATQEKLVDAADQAIKKAVEEVTKGLRIYFMVDISGSMQDAIAQAKTYLAKFLQGFPADQLHVSVFNTSGRVVEIKHHSATGVENAFRGITAGGGTDYGSGVRALQNFKPKADEDSIFIFVGDEEANPFDDAVRSSGLNPLAFGFLKVRNSPLYTAVTSTAANLGIPCFMIDERIFADPYAIPRTIRALVAATPVGKSTMVAVPRMSLVDVILGIPLLVKPSWAA